MEPDALTLRNRIKRGNSYNGGGENHSPS